LTTADNGNASSFIAMNTLAPTLDTQVAHPTYVRLMCIGLRTQGGDVDEALRMAGLPAWKQFVTSETFVSQRQINALASFAVARSGKHWLGLEVGDAAQISSHGPLGYAAVASKDLRQALQTVAHFSTVRYSAVRIRLHQNHGDVALEVSERLENSSVGGEFVMCMLFVTLLRLMESVVGHKLSGIGVDLPFSEPDWRSEPARFISGPLRFNARHMVFHLTPDLLEIPCVTADARAYALAIRECEQLLAANADLALGQRVRELFEGKDESYPSMTDVARYFSLSQRTFIRRLKQEGLRYQQLLDETRKSKAMWYLTHTRYRVEDIAERLGYKDTTNFSRTFRRWFGTTPGEFRLSGKSASKS